MVSKSGISQLAAPLTMISTRSPLRIFLICAVAGTAIVCVSAAARPDHPPPVREGPAGPPARLADGRVAGPPRLAPTKFGQAKLDPTKLDPAKHAPAKLAAARSRCPRASFGPHLYAPGRRRTLALTFDDGPGRSTARILSILRGSRVPATFFNIGENEAARRRLVREEYQDGFALGNHTWNHPDMTRLSGRGQAAEMDQTITKQPDPHFGQRRNASRCSLISMLDWISV